MNNTEPARPARGAMVAVAALAAVVICIIGVAFRGSWEAFRDAALAAHFGALSANLAPFAVDGLLVAAIIALVLLRHNLAARCYCLGIIGFYTVASWLINFLHGLGTFAVDPTTGQRPVPPWPVVGVIATLVIGTIFLGSHLLVYVARVLFPGQAAMPAHSEASQPGTERDGMEQTEPELDAPPMSAYDAAKAAYRHSLHPGFKRLSQRDMVERFGVSKRESSRIQAEIKDEMRDLAAASAGEDADTEPTPHTDNGHPVPVAP